MTITRSTLSDERYFLEFWTSALTYQRAAGLPSWPEYPREMIRAEIQAGRHFSARMFDDRPVGYFSLALSDPDIWGQDEKDEAIYVHRICVDPSARGKRFAAYVLSWACGYAAAAGRKYVRMDTWSENPGLIDYYISCGFRQIGIRQLGAVPNLPAHYNHLCLALFQNEIERTIPQSNQPGHR